MKKKYLEPIITVMNCKDENIMTDIITSSIPMTEENGDNDIWGGGGLFN